VTERGGDVDGWPEAAPGLLSRAVESAERTMRLTRNRYHAEELPPPPDPPEWLGGREPTWTPEIRAAMDAAAYRWGIPWTPKAPQ
jgi:hypothetical protein